MPNFTKGAARIVFAQGVHNLTLDSANTTGELITAKFGGPEPTVTTTDDGTVTITRRGAQHPFDWVRRTAVVSLNPGVAWDIEIRGVATQVEADLTGLRLRSITVTEGCTEARFQLPPTDVPVPVHFGSGVRKVTLLRPPETYAALRAQKGLTSLSLDGEWIGTLASADWRSAGPQGATGGYEITLASGSNHLTIA
ncbi:hypothetical protein GXW83_23060 [Streptacidiphilus sp. PB12-B1b]|uniref:hypothetical protein n=1 Tax=Streptacidiphilus sp. PB12-B1b TaxID=2705012 RepID=UPI0015F97ED2|nr:hypothetical protein [Streptacidiphilus sp. PB12-B1b]QMU78150.1 hypothetical protein GXW83_23060 [Streptacidiphilus sp. PB12-B1b]